MADQLVPQHNYRLDAAAMSGHHYGEVACRDFRESMVMSALPHQWREREDTRLQLAHFTHHRPAKGARARKAGSGPSVGGGGGRNGGGGGGSKGVEHSTNPMARALGQTAHAVTVGVKASGAGTGGVVAGGAPVGAGIGVGQGGLPSNTGPHLHALPAHVARARLPPNVIVAHQEEGIEVLHLFSGRTLCKMLLPPPGLHVDVNGDGVVDHIEAHGSAGGDGGGHAAVGADGHAVPACWAQATSGVPAREHLFNGSICRGASGVTRHGSRHMNGEPSGGYAANAHVEVAAPAVLRRGEETVVRSLRRAVKDMVFLNSRGEVTCYTHAGHRRWLQRTEASWARGGGDHASLTTLPLRPGGAVEVVLAVGASHATLLTPSGYKLASLRLPAPPIAPATIADVDGDGLHDLVLRTRTGVYCWTQRSHPGFLPFTFLLGALILGMSAAFVTQLPTADQSGRILRSTDYDEGSVGETPKDR